MENVFKTKEVSELLGVNPTTVKRWVKYFDIRCQMNEHGHYLFGTSHVEMLREIKGQLNAGKKMRDVHVSRVQARKEKRKDMIPIHQYEYQLKEMVNRIEEFEGKLSKKADEVVSYQLLRHRTELDQITTMLEKIEMRLQKVEESAKPIINEEVKVERPEKKRAFMQLFSI
ncbi:chromosome-anchoring protein RacA [Alkalihalobacillus sp. LMS39]|uniref:chromosome-anchoring protein RacA n=1 Tax=Alkalihalobacillus sp. LMS39 TaxID=2924032 RepID=UPI001FB3AE3D|nr:chromosome-anchoring protein RacA [Alkalihalobacillus sp. LMS39]UOE92296.1 chromosome-anchoring protein RacA [Alkalihalobacillus sp. LMS39]